MSGCPSGLHVHEVFREGVKEGEIQCSGQPSERHAFVYNAAGGRCAFLIPGKGFCGKPESDPVHAPEQGCDIPGKDHMGADGCGSRPAPEKQEEPPRCAHCKGEFLSGHVCACGESCLMRHPAQPAPEDAEALLAECERVLQECAKIPGMVPQVLLARLARRGQEGRHGE